MGYSGLTVNASGFGLPSRLSWGSQRLPIRSQLVQWRSRLYGLCAWMS